MESTKEHPNSNMANAGEAIAASASASAVPAPSSSHAPVTALSQVDADVALGIAIHDIWGRGPMFGDLFGMKEVFEKLLDVVSIWCSPQLRECLGTIRPQGLLLHGPPGCGKTMLAYAIANEAEVPLFEISYPELVSGVSGASGENIRDLFEKAYDTAPSIVFIDGIDAIAPNRENLQWGMERQVVTELTRCMDELCQKVQSTGAKSNSETAESKPGYVLVIGATNMLDAVDHALRRPGRFDHEIALGIPDENARVEILSMLTRGLKLDGHFNVLRIARHTSGFVGANLKDLVDQAGQLASARIVDERARELGLVGKHIRDWPRELWDAGEMETLSITMGDFEETTKMVQASLRSKGFPYIPDVTWVDVGGFNSLRKEFDRYIVQRIKHPQMYKKFGVHLEGRFLLHGPPGCSKTLIAKAVANEAGANFIHIKGPLLRGKHVGECESNVRKILTRARTYSPCILFFDEVDALMSKRGESGSWFVDPFLSQLLLKLEDADQWLGVYLIGATDRIEEMDPAVLRPDRFGKVLFIPLPGANERASIMRLHAQNMAMAIAADVDFDMLAHREEFENLTGAELAALMDEVAIAAKEEELDLEEKEGASSNPRIRTLHIDQALAKIKLVWYQKATHQRPGSNSVT
ncbi:cell division control protein 48 homolog C-like [Typha angustifolia]|uniref:cell division control protein 48 homolog C-like n=1 Tax=Typha angustifolia TaxID=59011 RepID=UPI003C2F6A0D